MQGPNIPLDTHISNTIDVYLVVLPMATFPTMYILPSELTDGFQLGVGLYANRKVVNVKYVCAILFKSGTAL